VAPQFGIVAESVISRKAPICRGIVATTFVAPEGGILTARVPLHRKLSVPDIFFRSIRTFAVPALRPKKLIVRGLPAFSPSVGIASKFLAIRLTLSVGTGLGVRVGETVGVMVFVGRAVGVWVGPTDGVCVRVLVGVGVTV